MLSQSISVNSWACAGPSFLRRCSSSRLLWSALAIVRLEVHVLLSWVEKRGGSSVGIVDEEAVAEEEVVEEEEAV